MLIGRFCVDLGGVSVDYSPVHFKAGFRDKGNDSETQIK